MSRGEESSGAQPPRRELRTTGRVGREAAALLFALAVSPDVAAQTVTGFAELKGYAYTDRVTTQEPWVIGWATALVKVEGRLGSWTYTASLRGEDISSAEAGPLVFDPADRELRRTPISLRELTLRIPLASALDLTLGRFELGWGKTDGYSPADSFLPRDLSDAYADEKLPLWGARLTGQRGVVRFELLGTAATTPFRLPVLVGRNAPLPIRPEVPVFLVDGESAPPREGFGALRLLGTFGEWDVGVWGRFGARPAPLLVFRTDRAFLTPLGVGIPADRRYVHESAAGAELSRVVGPFVVRGELAALWSSDAELGDALIWTLGAEKSFGDGTLLVTFAANARGTPVDPLLLFDRAILPAIVAIWSRSERWGSWRAVYMAGLEHGDGLLKAETTYSVTDSLSATLGGELPYGSRFGPFGLRWATRRLRLGVRQSW